MSSETLWDKLGWLSPLSVAIVGLSCAYCLVRGCRFLLVERVIESEMKSRTLKREYMKKN